MVPLSALYKLKICSFALTQSFSQFSIQGSIVLGSSANFQSYGQNACSIKNGG